MVTLQGEIVGLVMDADTARHHIERIHEHLTRADHHANQARKLILDLKERAGWKVLGYKSWRQCVMAEFEQSAANVYRQLDAAVVELELSPTGDIGQINERVLRPLTKRNFNTEARQAIWAISQEIVGAGGKVTSGITEAVVEGLTDMLRSGAAQDGDGEQRAITELMHADLVARVREKKISHKEHIRRMDKQRDYILGGRPAKDLYLADEYQGWGDIVKLAAGLNDSIEIEKLNAALKAHKTIYVSLWTED